MHGRRQTDDVRFNKASKMHRHERQEARKELNFLYSQNAGEREKGRKQPKTGQDWRRQKQSAGYFLDGGEQAYKTVRLNGEM